MTQLKPTMQYQLINGDIVPEAEARIPLTDLGLLRSYSVFDFFRVLNGVPVFIDDHVERLLGSARALNIDTPWSHSDIVKMCVSLIEANSAVNAGLRIIVTGGYAMDGYSPSTPNIYMMLHTLPTYDPALFLDGGHLITEEYERDMPSAKTTMYAHVISLRSHLKECGADEVLYYDSRGISECSRSNVFFVDGDRRIHTPKHGMLRGITRKQTIDLAQGKFEVIERDIPFAELDSFQEVFITSSTKGILPIITIDNTEINNRMVGPVTTEMMQHFAELIAKITKTPASSGA